MARPLLANLTTDKLSCYLFVVSLDEYEMLHLQWSPFFYKECVPNKTRDIYVKLFTLITGVKIKHSKTYFLKL